MKKLTAIAVCLLATAGLYWFAEAGNMEPPGPPAPTMVTLQQIFDKVGSNLPAKTGQTGCWDKWGTPISCADTGQDGEYQYGFSVDPRFRDNGDGTVTDNLTNLIWLKNADCWSGPAPWDLALFRSNELQQPQCGLTDGSLWGDWRLPNVRELQSLIDYSQYSPAVPPGHPFSGVQSYFYWSSTSHADTPYLAWTVYLNYGFVSPNDKANSYYVWPVRGGQ